MTLLYRFSLVALAFPVLVGCQPGETADSGDQQQVTDEGDSNSPPANQGDIKGEGAWFAPYMPADAPFAITLNLEPMLDKLGEKNQRPNRLIDYTKDQVYFDADEIARVTFVLLPEDLEVFSELLDEEFLFASIIQFKEARDPIATLPLPPAPDDFIELSLAGEVCEGYMNYSLQGMHAIAKYWLDEKTLFVGPHKKLEKMFSETAGTGQLAAMCSEFDPTDDCTLLLALDGMPDVLAQLVGEEVVEGDPDLQASRDALVNVESITWRLRLNESPMAHLKLASSDAETLDRFESLPQHLLKLYELSLNGIVVEIPEIMQIVQTGSNCEVERGENALSLLLPPLETVQD